MTTTTEIALTDSEALVLALIGSQGEAGLQPYSPLARKFFGEYGTGTGEALLSLRRFGYVADVRWTAPGVPFGQTVLTESGLDRYAAIRRRTDYYSGCPGCVRLFCVCSRRLGCLLVHDPERPEGQYHASLGCKGTHD
jgi:hypothetical protein